MMRVAAILLLSSAVALAQPGPAFRWIQQVPANGTDQAAGVGLDSQGNTYIAGTRHTASRDQLFAAKYDPSGNLLFNKTFGGSGTDFASAAVVDSAGNTYITGATGSADFPTTAGAWSERQPGATSYVLKLTPEGNILWASYFTTNSSPRAIAVDSAGQVYITGSTSGLLPVTPGAYRSICSCKPIFTGFFTVFPNDGFVTAFDPQGAHLAYSTYLGVQNASPSAIAIAPDHSAYIAGDAAIQRLSASGSALLASSAPIVFGRAIAIAPNGSVYLAGEPAITGDLFQTTADAYQPHRLLLPNLPISGPPQLPAGIVKMDAQLSTIQFATYFGGHVGTSISSIALEQNGDLLVAGLTSPRSFPLVTPLVEAFGPAAGTGFVAKLTGDLSQLLFSSPFGDNNQFRVQGVAPAPDGTFVLAGTTNLGYGLPTSVWVNNVIPRSPQPFRLDSVENAASQLHDPLTANETVVIRGAGFTADALVLINGQPIQVVSHDGSSITAVLPATLPSDLLTLEVRTADTLSNALLIRVASAAPGIYTADGNGVGPAYIVNEDGTVNTPSNPAGQGEKITLYLTGIGAFSLNQGYAEPQHPISVILDGFYCPGVAAVMRPVAGLPGDVFQLTVRVPSPNRKGFAFPSLVPILLNIDGAESQPSLSVSVKP